MNFNHLANKLRYKVTKFPGTLSHGLDKTARRFVQEAIYGIIASESVMLTEIGRQMESRVSLKKTEERFSRLIGKASIPEHNRLDHIDHLNPVLTTKQCVIEIVSGHSRSVFSKLTLSLTLARFLPGF
jgi:hypothetical protein